MSNNNAPKRKTAVQLAAAFAAAAALSGCATAGSTLNSRDQSTNTFTSDIKRDACLNDAAACAAGIPVGTPRGAVFAKLGINSKLMHVMSRQEVNVALYGQQNLTIDFNEREKAQKFMDSLQGYSMVYNNVKGHSSLTWSGTRIHSVGDNYTLNFVFQNDRLYAPISYTATPVNETHSKGWLSNLSGVIMGGAMTAF